MELRTTNILKITIELLIKVEKSYNNDKTEKKQTTKNQKPITSHK
jgi:hypothetical protein